VSQLTLRVTTEELAQIARLCRGASQPVAALLPQIDFLLVSGEERDEWAVPEGAEA
jgi:hypothetical protein